MNQRTKYCLGQMFVYLVCSAILITLISAVNWLSLYEKAKIVALIALPFVVFMFLWKLARASYNLKTLN